MRSRLGEVFAEKSGLDKNEIEGVAGELHKLNDLEKELDRIALEIRDHLKITKLRLQHSQVKEIMEKAFHNLRDGIV